MRRLISMIATFVCVTSIPCLGQDIDFTRDIQPIFTKHCQSCHGPDKQKGGLRLDDRQAAIQGGDTGPAWVNSKANESELIKRIRGDEPDDIMPPKGDPLTKEQIALLTKWIDGGANWPEANDGQAQRRTSKHWSFQPVKREPLPKVNDAAWPRNGIDHFILAKLEEQNIRPSPEADRYTLIRRLYLDLLGLLPTPEEADAFVNDTSKDAYEKLVDRLLASPHYGERWGRHWLDQARYADSNGYSVDSARTMWPYRDWVIAAINADMPFDQFTIEQLAGDLLPDATRDQIIATAFHRNTMINQEGGVKADQFRIEASYDRVATTSQVWLGLTIACAQCHTHKFDPITQKEYYQFFAFFNSTEDANNTGPTMAVTSPENEAIIERAEAKLATAEEKLRELDKAAKATNGQKPKDKNPKPAAKELKDVQWTPLETVSFESKGGATLEQLEDGSILVGGKLSANDTYEIKVKTKLAYVAALRLETLTHDTLPANGPGLASNGNFVMTKVTLEQNGKVVPWSDAVATHEQPGYTIRHAIDDNTDTGWAINTGQGTPAGVKMNDNHNAYFFVAEPAKTRAGSLLVSLRFERNPNYLLGRFRLSITDDADALKPEKPPVDDERQTLVKEIASLKKEIADARKNQPSVMVMRELPKPRPSHVFIRGDFLRLGAAVTPDVPQVLPALNRDVTATKPQASSPKPDPKPDTIPTRLDLARWLVSPENPLTPRVTMNRIWLRYFPKGLVVTEEDFGTQGTPPTHPELLDWLASEFTTRKWSMKAMHKLIVTSATYRQASTLRSDLVEVDPFNRLLARQSRLRVEAEIVRDVALTASGLLSNKIGGPGVRPPQPAGVYDFTQNRQSWNVATGEDRYRRGMYTFFFRSAPYPMLTTFDVPNLTQTCTARIRSNTPLQSLTMANDDAIFEMAQALALRVLADADAKKLNTATDASRITQLFRLCMTRPPDAYESSRLLSLLKQQRERFTKDANAAAQIAPAQRPKELNATEAAAWTAVARTVMNLDEFITRE